MPGEVAILPLDRAERMNSFDVAALVDLHEAIAAHLRDPAVSAVVLTGKGKAFSVGADVAAFKKGLAEGSVVDFVLQATEHLHPMLEAVHQADKPVVAAVNGVAAGGGLGLALAADGRVGSPAARFAASYFGIGASPDGGSTWLMPRLIGTQRTRRFFLHNEVMDADEALRIGLLDQIVPADDLVDAAVAMAAEWGGWARHSIEATKRLLATTLHNDLHTHLELERQMIAVASGTTDFKEGVTAFLEKRPPAFGAR